MTLIRSRNTETEQYKQKKIIEFLKEFDIFHELAVKRSYTVSDSVNLFAIYKEFNNGE